MSTGIAGSQMAMYKQATLLARLPAAQIIDTVNASCNLRVVLFQVT